MSLVDGMVLAILNQERYDVVLPIMWGGMSDYTENISQPMQFGDLYMMQTILLDAFQVYMVEVPSEYFELFPVNLQQKTLYLLQSMMVERLMMRIIGTLLKMLF